MAASSKLMSRKDIARLLTEKRGEDVKVYQVLHMEKILRPARIPDLNKRVVRYDSRKVKEIIEGLKANEISAENSLFSAEKKPSVKRELKPVRGLKLLLRLGIIKKAEARTLLSSSEHCKICLRPFDQKRRKVVDHDHKTMKVRGVLCFRCNSLLGMANDSPDMLRVAALYLEK